MRKQINSINKSGYVGEDLRVSKKAKKEVILPCQMSQNEDTNIGEPLMTDEHRIHSIENKSDCTECDPKMLSSCSEIDGHLTNGKDIKRKDLVLATKSTKLHFSFFNVPCEDLAKGLLGKILVRRLENGLVLKGRIVETECYLGGDDKASHSYNGKITPRNKPMYMKPGTTYVYFTYGMYYCFNISSQGDGAAVLIRAVDPIIGHDYMNTQRVNKRMSSKKKLQLGNLVTNSSIPTIKHHELCNGPGKLCISFCIDEKSCNMQDLSTWEGMWIESDCESEKVNYSDFITSTRIGIDAVEPEWALKPLRYYIYGNRSVSRRDRKKEQEKLNY